MEKSLLFISPDWVYPTSELAVFGLGGFALRQAYRAGLKRYRLGRKTFIKGSDLIASM